MKLRCLRRHVCKFRSFCTLPKAFPKHRCAANIVRARDGLRELSDHAQTEETKGISLTSATEIALASTYKRSFSGDI